MSRYDSLLGTWLGLAALISFAGCSSGDSPAPAGSTGQLKTGTVALLLADGPADEYEKIVITITEATLLPADEDQDPVVLYDSDDGIQVDLLEYRDDDFLFLVNRSVPAGTYRKIRLGISNIETQGGPCDDMELKLPSGRIELKPKEPFEVAGGETLSIRLDIDANKSINLHPAGKSGKCIFRPVVFVDIEKGPPIRRCPRSVKGTITELVKEEEETIGFIFDLLGRRGDLEVTLTEDTEIVDDSGSPSGADALAVEQFVRVWGRLDDEGRLEAKTILIGEILTLNGVVSRVAEEGGFTLDIDAGQGVVGSVDVELTEATVVLGGCHLRLNSDAIQVGALVKVSGKLFLDSEENDVLRAVVVFVQFVEFEGDLIAIEPADGGHVLSVEIGNGTEGDPAEETEPVKFFLREGRGILLEGDGEIPMDLMAHLVECAGRRVRVRLNPDFPRREILEIRVASDVETGEVESVDPLMVDGKLIQVATNATILDLNSDQLITLDVIESGDEVRLFGLTACEEDDVGFYASVVLLLPEILEGEGEE